MSATGITLLLGLGRFGGGREAARFLHRHGHSLRIADKAAAEQLEESVQALAGLAGIDWCLGREDLDLLEGVELLVANPGVPDRHPLLKAAHELGIAISQEVNLFLEHFPGKVVLITGTNGKSTTTTLLQNVLERCAIPCLAGGNIGKSLLACEAEWSAEQVAILEISSFQLERIDTERHRVSGTVLTRITEDHLDRHGSLEVYQRAKARAALVAEDFLVHGAADPVACSFESPAIRRIQFLREASREAELSLHSDYVTDREGLPVVHADALELIGRFHLDNVMAAHAAATELGADRHRAGLGLASTRPLPFRLQELARLPGGVRIFDNSVSTALESTLSAIEALRGPIHWVGGGKSKDDRFAECAEALGPQLVSAHLFGASAGPMARAFGECEPELPTTEQRNLQEALASARKVARSGEAILFSPAFASFDQFANFRARAEAFHAWLATSL